MRPGAGRGLGSWPAGLGPGPLMQVHSWTSPTASHDITSFVGQRRDVMRWPPACRNEKIEVLRLFRRITHTPHRSGVVTDENESENYLTRTPRGERKRREEGENTNTNTPGPERANPEKAREKKNGGRRAKPNRPAEGGEDRSA